MSLDAQGNFLVRQSLSGRPTVRPVTIEVGAQQQFSLSAYLLSACFDVRDAGLVRIAHHYSHLGLCKSEDLAGVFDLIR